MPMYELRLMGSPTLTVRGADVHINRRKAVALLAYLAVTGRAHSRDALAELLWPDVDVSVGRGYLRRRLSQVNRLLGGDGIEADWETAQLNPALDLWLDVVAFRRYRAGCGVHAHNPQPDARPALRHCGVRWTSTVTTSWRGSGWRTAPPLTRGRARTRNRSSRR